MSPAAIRPVFQPDCQPGGHRGQPRRSASGSAGYVSASYTACCGSPIPYLQPSVLPTARDYPTVVYQLPYVLLDTMFQHQYRSGSLRSQVSRVPALTVTHHQRSPTDGLRFACRTLRDRPPTPTCSTAESHSELVLPATARYAEPTLSAPVEWNPRRGTNTSSTAVGSVPSSPHLSGRADPPEDEHRHRLVSRESGSTIATLQRPLTATVTTRRPTQRVDSSARHHHIFASRLFSSLQYCPTVRLPSPAARTATAIRPATANYQHARRGRARQGGRQLRPSDSSSPRPAGVENRAGSDAPTRAHGTAHGRSAYRHARTGRYAAGLPISILRRSRASRLVGLFDAFPIRGTSHTHPKPGESEIKRTPSATHRPRPRDSTHTPLARGARTPRIAVVPSGTDRRSHYNGSRPRPEV